MHIACRRRWTDLPAFSFWGTVRALCTAVAALLVYGDWRDAAEKARPFSIGVSGDNCSG